MTIDTFRASFLSALRTGRLPLAPCVDADTFVGCSTEEIALAFTWAHGCFLACYADNDGAGMDSYRNVLSAVRSANKRNGGRALRLR